MFSKVFFKKTDPVSNSLKGSRSAFRRRIWIRQLNMDLDPANKFKNLDALPNLIP